MWYSYRVMHFWYILYIHLPRNLGERTQTANNKKIVIFDNFERSSLPTSLMKKGINSARH